MARRVHKPPTLIHGVPPPPALTVTVPCPGPGITPGRDTPGQRGADPEKAEKLTEKARRWTYTLNNYSDAEIEALTAYSCERHICGKEVGEECGTPHLQGYFRFKNPVRKAALVKAFPRAKFFKAISFDTQNETYCSKQGNVIINTGYNFDESDGPDKKLTRDEEADIVIEKIEKRMKYGDIRRSHKRFCFWHRRQVLDYMRDEDFLREYPDHNPTV